ncbi:MAG: hypothetical protein SVU32_09605, partial [Candidatus Nanohaloarchaea archaeon]|nr:hypothetical protein [Candidatus Nanohaloarchaea archaeon]
ETLDNPVMDWYDTFIVSMDDAHDVRYSDGLMQDRHIILEGVTPLHQPGHIDESYNTARRTENVTRAVRRAEWRQYDGVGDEIAPLLEDRRPTETSPEAVEEALEEAYPRVGPMFAGRIDLS